MYILLPNFRYGEPVSDVTGHLLQQVLSNISDGGAIYATFRDRGLALHTNPGMVDIYSEEEVTPENQNATLLMLAEDDIDDGDKVCTEPQPEAISDAVEMITDVNCI